MLSRSSVESEYRVMANKTCELVWVRDLLTELDFTPECPMRLYCDNLIVENQVFHITENPVFRECIKHVKVDCHLVR